MIDQMTELTVSNMSGILEFHILPWQDKTWQKLCVLLELIPYVERSFVIINRKQTNKQLPECSEAAGLSSLPIHTTTFQYCWWIPRLEFI